MGFPNIQSLLARVGHIVNPWLFLTGLWVHFGLHEKLGRLPAVLVDISSVFHKWFAADTGIPKNTLAEAVFAQQSGDPALLEKATGELAPFVVGILRSLAHPGVKTICAAEALDPFVLCSRISWAINTSTDRQNHHMFAGERRTPP